MRIFKFIKPYRLTFSIGFIFLILTSLLSLVFPLLMGQLFGTSSNVGSATEIASKINFNLKDINTVVILLFGVFGLQAIVSFFRIYLFSKVTEGTLADIRQTAYNHIVSLPISFFNKNKVGELTSRIASDITLMQETFNTTIAEFIRQTIMVVGGLVFLTIISPKLLGIMLASVPIMAIIAVFFGRYIKNLSKEAQEKTAESTSIVEETLSGITIVKAFTREIFEFNRYKTKTDAVKNLSIKAARMRGAFVSFLIFFMFGAIVFIIWQGLVLVDEGELALSEFISFLFYTVFIGASIGSLPDMYAKIQKAIGSTEHLMEILELEPEEISTQSTNGDVKLNGKVDFENINFSYDSRKDVQVLEDINFNANPGETIALVGPSGAGKSTIASLLLRFYNASKGNIYIDDKDISEYQLNELRGNMAIVPQEVILFGGTIYENIAYGKNNPTEAEIIAAAKKANAWEFIEKFPDGLETLVGDRGIQLSGGQKQRIAIARAVLNDPAILILDEATSALDSESEKLVQEALNKLMSGRTSFVIAHRLSTIKNADKIVVIENGKIEEIGKHQDLINKEGGLYAKLSEIQFNLS